MNNCSCRPNCIGIAVLSALVLGIIAGFLTFSGILTLPVAFLWTAFGIAAGSLGLLLVLTSFSCARALRCICNALSVLLLGILGTILTSLILILIDITLASVAGAVITALLVLFFTLFITAFACVIRCIASCDE
ncbi:MAG: hypothetical protein IKU60_05825 [Clostridia bacterium]|nr:hypothetical protein [Clostridia bacterium]